MPFTVVEKSGILRSKESYKDSNSWASWSFNTLVRQPISWSAQKLLGSPVKQSKVYVWPEILKKVSEEILEMFHPSVPGQIMDRLISYSAMRSLCQTHVPNDGDFELVVNHLEKGKKISILESSDHGLLIKVGPRGERKAEPITEIDIQCYEIQKAQKKLEQETEILVAREEELTVEAKHFLKEGKKSMALHCLRKKKGVSKMLNTKFSLLKKLHDIMMQIEGAETNEMVLKACEAGLGAMKALNKDLSQDRVESVMEGVQENIEDMDEVGKMLSGPMTSEDGENTTELEKELDSLLSEETKGSQTDNDCSPKDISLPDLSMLSLSDLPDVPSDLPSSSIPHVQEKPDVSKQKSLLAE